MNTHIHTQTHTHSQSKACTLSHRRMHSRTRTCAERRGEQPERPDALGSVDDDDDDDDDADAGDETTAIEPEDIEFEEFSDDFARMTLYLHGDTMRKVWELL